MDGLTIAEMMADDGQPWDPKIHKPFLERTTREWDVEDFPDLAGQKILITAGCKGLGFLFISNR